MLVATVLHLVLAAVLDVFCDRDPASSDFVAPLNSDPVWDGVYMFGSYQWYTTRPRSSPNRVDRVSDDIQWYLCTRIVDALCERSYFPCIGSGAIVFNLQETPMLSTGDSVSDDLDVTDSEMGFVEVGPGSPRSYWQPRMTDGLRRGISLAHRLANNGVIPVQQRPGWPNRGTNSSGDRMAFYGKTNRVFWSSTAVFGGREKELTPVSRVAESFDDLAWVRGPASSPSVRSGECGRPLSFYGGTNTGYGAMLTLFDGSHLYNYFGSVLSAISPSTKLPSGGSGDLSDSLIFETISDGRGFVPWTTSDISAPDATGRRYIRSTGSGLIQDEAFPHHRPVDNRETISAYEAVSSVETLREYHGTHSFASLVKVAFDSVKDHILDDFEKTNDTATVRIELAVEIPEQHVYLFEPVYHHGFFYISASFYVRSLEDEDGGRGIRVFHHHNGSNDVVTAEIDKGAAFTLAEIPSSFGDICANHKWDGGLSKESSAIAVLPFSATIDLHHGNVEAYYRDIRDIKDIPGKKVPPGFGIFNVVHNNFSPSDIVDSQAVITKSHGPSQIRFTEDDLAQASQYLALMDRTVYPVNLPEPAIVHSNFIATIEYDLEGTRRIASSSLLGTASWVSVNPIARGDLTTNATITAIQMPVDVVHDSLLLPAFGNPKNVKRSVSPNGVYSLVRSNAADRANTALAVAGYSSIGTHFSSSAYWGVVPDNGFDPGDESLTLQLVGSAEGMLDPILSLAESLAAADKFASTVSISVFAELSEDKRKVTGFRFVGTAGEAAQETTISVNEVKKIVSDELDLITETFIPQYELGVRGHVVRSYEFIVPFAQGSGSGRPIYGKVSDEWARLPDAESLGSRAGKFGITLAYSVARHFSEDPGLGGEFSIYDYRDRVHGPGGPRMGSDAAGNTGYGFVERPVRSSPGSLTSDVEDIVRRIVGYNTADNDPDWGIRINMDERLLSSATGEFDTRGDSSVKWWNPSTYMRILDADDFDTNGYDVYTAVQFPTWRFGYLFNGVHIPAANGLIDSSEPVTTWVSSGGDLVSHSYSDISHFVHPDTDSGDQPTVGATYTGGSPLTEIYPIGPYNVKNHIGNLVETRVTAFGSVDWKWKSITNKP